MTASWTLADAPRLEGRTALITGANSGIGYEMAVALADKGVHVVMACRNPARAHAALTTLRDRVPGARAEVAELDVSSLASVRACAARFLAQHVRLDFFLQNAGIMMVPYARTDEGLESQMATNHVGHFALTGLLLPLIEQTPGARVVTVSSIAHKRGALDLADPFFQAPRGYSPVRAYARSKLANLLFAYELQRRLERRGIDAIALSSHPGFTAQTNLANHFGSLARAFMPLFRMMGQLPAEGALPTLRAALDPEARGGTYYGPAGGGERRGPPVLVRSSPTSADPALAEGLWRASEEASGVSYLAV